ncbi:MAG TPA: glycosyltransferase family A protein [Chloroflexia bacterium]|nr:glycosyltransferase family A protein [Chloroflexia bacterium]
MSPAEPKIGVVIPTYNRAPLLRRALDSVLAQTVQPERIVVVDDGSTDDSAGVVARAAEHAVGGPEIIFLHGPHENRRGIARNRGAAAAGTPFIAFLDSDDLWKPRRLERQLSAWRSAPQAMFAFCNVQYFADDGLVGVPCLPPGRDFNGYILGDMLEEPRAVSSTLVVRREAFEAVGGFRDMRMNEDYELSLRLAARYRASYVPEVLVLMREHQGRTSRQGGELPLLDSVALIDRFLRERPHLPRKVRNKGTSTLANMHYKLAQMYTERGDARLARSHLGKSLRLRPWSRRALASFLRLREWRFAEGNGPKI